MTTERWKPVVGYEGKYEVSDQGRVRSLDRWTGNRFFKGQIIRPGVKHPDYPYLIVCLTADGKGRMHKVHKLVLEAFCGPRPEGMQGCHNDGDHNNCRLDNLRWDTAANNALDRIKHGRQHRKVPVTLVKKIMAMAESVDPSTREGRKEISTALKCPARLVWRVLCTDQWNHVDLIDTEKRHS